VQGKSLRELLIGARDDKQEWRAYVKRREALPPAYRVVMADIENYMYNIGIMDASSMSVFYQIIDLFEEGAAAGRGVLDVTGQDVAAFAYDMLMAVAAKTWTGQQAAKLNDRVHRHLAGLGSNG